MALQNIENYSVREIAQSLSSLRKQIFSRQARIKAETSQLEKDEALARDVSERLWFLLKHRDCVASGNTGFEKRLEELICELCDQ